MRFVVYSAFRSFLAIFDAKMEWFGLYEREEALAWLKQIE